MKSHYKQDGLGNSFNFHLDIFKNTLDYKCLKSISNIFFAFRKMLILIHQFSMLHKKLEGKSKSKPWNYFWHNFAFIIHHKKSLKVLEGWESIKITERINPRSYEIFSEGAFSQDGYYQFVAILTWKFIKSFILL